MSMDIQRPTLKGNERQLISDVISGKKDPNSKKSSKVLSRPHVAVALESILDMAGLTDDSLAKRLGEIINREETISTSKLGTISTNITSIDSNALNAIRTVWQAKGRFSKEDSKKLYGLEGLSDDQLDGIIQGGISITNIQKRTIERTPDSAIDITSTPST